MGHSLGWGSLVAPPCAQRGGPEADTAPPTGRGVLLAGWSTPGRNQPIYASSHHYDLAPLLNFSSSRMSLV